VREETRIAVEACVAALNAEWTPEERERHSRPPYPFPDRLVGQRDVIFAEIERRRRDGATYQPCVLTTLDQWLQPWESIANQVENRLAPTCFSTALTLLSGTGDMAASEFEDVIPRVPDDITRNALRSQLIHLLLEAGEIGWAEQVSETMEPFYGRDQRFLGHRRVALSFAQQGDAAAFFARWPRLAASQERHHMGELKRILVESVGRVHGWQQAIDVASDRRLGPTYRIYAFTSLADAGEVEQLCELFAAHEGVLDELDELTALVSALATKATSTGIATQEPATAILHRIIAIEPSSKAVVRRRDAMMLTLWPAYPDTDTLALARKSVRTPSIKRELTQLHPDIARLGPG
jgi:hypothetical protein